MLTFHNDTNLKNDWLAAINQIEADRFGPQKSILGFLALALAEGRLHEVPDGIDMLTIVLGVPRGVAVFVSGLTALMKKHNYVIGQRWYTLKSAFSMMPVGEESEDILGELPAEATNHDLITGLSAETCRELLEGLAAAQEVANKASAGAAPVMSKSA
jgi:hypothetical protein